MVPRGKKAAWLMLSLGEGPAGPAGQRRRPMLYYALVFLIVGLVAGALGIYTVAAVASQIAWVLFLIGVVLLVIHLASGRSRPVL
jgi:uncharacterized membrane protein YtjA (UPF0391 family)